MTGQQHYRITLALKKIQDILEEINNQETFNDPKRIQLRGNYYLMEIQNVIDHVPLTEDKKQKKN